MKQTLLLGWLLAGMVVFAGGAAGIGTETPINETTSTTVPESADTTMPKTTSQEMTNPTTRQQRAITNQSARNASNVTVPINSTTLSGNCSVSVATRGNATIGIFIEESGNETGATANVSAAWLVYTNRVDRVNERVNERLSEWVSNMSAIRSTSIGRSNTTTVQGEHVGRVVVGVAPEQVNEVRDEIPRQINCVEIVVRPMGRIVGTGGSSAVITGSIENSSMPATMAEKATPTETTSSEATTSSSTGPGFGVGAAVVGVSVLVLVRRRR